MTKTRGFLLAAAIVAMALLTLSCSDSNDDHSTFYLATYGINNSQVCSEIDEMLIGNSNNMDDMEGVGLSFTDVKNSWTYYRSSFFGSFLGDQYGVTEDDLRNHFGLPPSEFNTYMRGLNQRGNQLTVHFSLNPTYCYVIAYVEKET